MSDRPKSLADRVRELGERLGELLDGLIPVPEPELVPVPVRRPDPRRPVGRPLR